MPVPLLSGHPGDGNADGDVGIDDIEAITAAVQGQSTNPLADVNSHGTIDQEDRRFWLELEGIRNTYFGDSNLDGEFNSGDFVAVFQAGEYEDGVAGNSTRATGDWNGDGEFDTSNFVFAFKSGGYERGPRVQAAAVPEPSGFALILLSVACVALVTRRPGIGGDTHQS